MQNGGHYMRKLVIVGGSRGIGAAFIHKLHLEYDCIFNVDILDPIERFDNVKTIRFDLFKDDINSIKTIISNANTLIITAGIGSVKSFEKTSIIEIKKTIQINTTSIIMILKLFYNSLLYKSNIKCLVMGSIAGDVSSPLFSLYGSSKSALNKICESINIELEKNNSLNRITCVKPISFPGTSFNGKETVLSDLYDIAEQFLSAMNDSQAELYYPADICYNVVSRYSGDKHQFGIDSYDYKIKNNRLNHDNNIIVGYLSGTFDLFHIGHLNLLKKAKEQCDYLIVGVHKSGKWKGKDTFIPFKERIEIVKSIKYVDEVHESLLEDSDAWDVYHYNILFVGSDYKGSERFNRYERILKNKAKIVYFPYTKGTSSTILREAITNSNNK